MIKKLLFFLIPLILIITHSAQKINSWLKTKQKLEGLKNEISQLEEENRVLAEKKEYYQSEEYIYRQAREKFGMSKGDEIAFIMPELPDLSILSQKGEMYQNLQNWQKWIQLFVHKEG